jgi:hypothetical protein
LVAKCSTISEKFEIKAFVYLHSYHGNGSHFEKGKYFKALPHGGCHYCEVSLLKVQPSLRKMKVKKCKQFCGYHGNGSHFEIF